MTKVNLVDGALKETSMPGLYSSLANGMAADPVYPADNISIFQGNWVQMAGKPIQQAVAEIGTDTGLLT